MDLPGKVLQELQHLSCNNKQKQNDAVEYLSYNSKSKPLEIYQTLMYLLVSEEKISGEALNTAFEICSKAFANFYSKLETEIDVKVLVVDSLKSLSILVSRPHCEVNLEKVSDALGNLLDMACKCRLKFSWDSFWPDVMASFPLVSQNRPAYIGCCLSVLLKVNKFYLKLGVFSNVESLDILSEVLQVKELFLVGLKTIKSFLLFGPGEVQLKLKHLSKVIIKNSYQILQSKNKILFGECVKVLTKIAEKVPGFFYECIQEVVQFSTITREMLKDSTSNDLKFEVLGFSHLVLFEVYEKDNDLPTGKT